MFKKNYHPLDSRHPANLAAQKQLQEKRAQLAQSAGLVQSEANPHTDSPYGTEPWNKAASNAVRQPMGETALDFFSSPASPALTDKKTSFLQSMSILPKVLYDIAYETRRIMKRLYIDLLILVVVILVIVDPRPMTTFYTWAFSDVIEDLVGPNARSNLSTNMSQMPIATPEPLLTPDNVFMTDLGAPVAEQNSNGAKFMSAPSALPQISK